MNYLYSFFLCWISCQSALFAQTDSTKKRFKPYGLIDAAPVAISIKDLKSQNNLTLQVIDAITNLPVDAKIDYYSFEDSVVKSKNGKIISLAAQGSERVFIVLNAPGYIWQTEIFNTPETDTTCILRIKKIRKGEEITLNKIDFRLQNNKFQSDFYGNLLGLREFLKINLGVKIQISGCPKEKEKVFLDLMKNSNEKRINFKSSANQKNANLISIRVKILHA